MTAQELVLDASAMIDLLTAGRRAVGIRRRLAEATVHVPSHFDAEVLSALGRLVRAGELPADEVPALLAAVDRAPITRHPLPELLAGGWARRDRLRLVDALYARLADRLGVTLLTTDARLANAYPAAELP